jgi:hypothetical protein
MNRIRRQSTWNYHAERGNATRDARSEGIYHDSTERFFPTQQKANDMLSKGTAVIHARVCPLNHLVTNALFGQYTVP